MQYSSLIYACLPKVYDLIQENTGSIVVVVCPLIAVMKDQVTSFKNLGLSTAYVGEKTVKSELFLPSLPVRLLGVKSGLRDYV